MTGAALMDKKRPKRKDAAVKIDEEIAWKAKTITSFRKISIAEYLSGILRPIVDRDFEKFRKDLQADK